jgi:RNA polymerase sigma-70 factor (ECF subfamily)
MHDGPFRPEDLVPHREFVVATCTRFVGDPARGEELAHDVLALAVERVGTFRGDGSLRTWLYRMSRNLCFNAIRRHGELLTADGVLDGPDSALTLAYQTLRREERDALVREAAAALTPDEQEVVLLRYVEGLPNDRITALLDLPGVGARATLQRCRRKLRAEVERALVARGHGTSFLRLTSGDRPS